MTLVQEPTDATQTAGQWWRRWRTVIAAGALVAIAGTTLALIGSSLSSGTLDPDSPSQGGSRALAHLLHDQGVTVRRTQGVAQTAALARPGTTVLVVQPDLLSSQQADRLRSTGADLVLLATSVPTVLDAFLPGASLGNQIAVRTRDPACGLDAAQAAGSASAGGVTYAAPGATSCYDASLVTVQEPGGRTVSLLGSPQALRNDHLAEHGNAALSMNLLGVRRVLLWEMPSLEDSASTPHRTLTDLLPHWVAPTLVQLVIAVVLLALWRARRLGPVVEEPLPVVVRSAEVTEGRARLYRRARARGRAASELRRACAGRIAPLVGIGPGADPAELVAAVAERTGRDPRAVGALLYGGVPADDPTLVALADELDRIEEEVRRS
ncbi:MAG TPA: DUF4350 domain-containing protein [Actinomycetes bacterium]|nr:DUF4350 domain-containing protein [Actinomycetes bacterium]